MLPKIVNKFNNAELQRRATDLDKIIEYLTNEETEGLKLSEKQQEMLNRYDFADNLIRKYIHRGRVANILMKKFKISKAQAYKDIRDSKIMFNSTNKLDKEYWRGVAHDWIVDCIRTAVLEKNNKDRIAAVAVFVKLHQFDKEFTDFPDFAAIQQNIYHITMNPEVLGINKDDDIETRLEKYKNRLKESAEDAEIIE